MLHFFKKYPLSAFAVFSKLDAVKGFWQIPLDEKSSKLCTFNTPIRRYRFTRLPFGICDASEVYQQAMETEFGDIAKIIIDDILVSGETREEHDWKLLEVLKRARKINLKFNKYFITIISLKSLPTKSGDVDENR